MKILELRLAIAAGLFATGSMAAGQESVPREDPSPVVEGAISEQTLEGLIPDAAQENPEDWATPDQQRPSENPQASVLEPEPVTDGGDPFDIATALQDAQFDEPAKLTPDSERPSFEQIDAPSLVDLPDLAEFDISDQLILAFPAEAGRFPEEAEFIARFQALSALEALDTGEDTVPQIAARARSDADLLAAMLRNYGYYNGEVIRQLSGGRRGFADDADNNNEPSADSDPRVRFDVLPGSRYTFGQLNLGKLDQLADADRRPLLDAFGIREGVPLYADAIVSGEAGLRLALGQNGYPFGEIGSPDLIVDHSRQEGDLTLPVDPGGQYAFGEVVSDDPEFLSGRHLGAIARFDPGDLYQTSMQADLRRAILATGLVSSIAITPREVSGPGVDTPGEVALDVTIERAPLRTISGAIGYGTEDGFKLEAGWEHRNLFPPEGALRLRGVVGTREQLASITFRRNNFRDRDQILSVDAFASDIETEAVDARTVALRGSFERVSNLLFQKPLSWQLGTEVLYSDERTRTGNRDIFSARQEYLIGSIFGSATIDASDDLLDPTSGFRFTGFAAPEVSRSLGDEAFYLRARADGSFYQSVGSTVLAGRVAAASILGADAFEIAPSRRLYSGGGGSVRGYGFQAIGPRDEFGQALGGGSLVEAAFEARIQTGLLDGAVEVVPFIDAGTISRRARPDFEVFRIGAGIGVRYKTTFGPIRVDVGAPVNPGEFDAPVVVYVSLGQAF